MSNSQISRPFFALRQKVLIILGFFLFTLGGKATFASALPCPILMAVGLNQSDSTAIYVALLRKLALEKGAFSTEALREMRSQAEAPNPLEFLSRDLESSEKFSYARAFKLLADLDWPKAQKELENILGELTEKVQHQKTAKENIASIYIAVAVNDITSRESFTWQNQEFVSEGRAPIFITYRNNKTYLVDLENQTSRELAPFALTQKAAFTKLRGVRTVVAYSSGSPFSGKIEDVNTGEVLQSFNVVKDFSGVSDLKLADQPFHMSLREKTDGNLKLLITGRKFPTRFVYDFGTHEKYVLEIPAPLATDSTIHTIVAEDRQGEVYAFRSHGEVAGVSRFSLFQISKDKSQTLIDFEISPLAEGEAAVNAFLLENGRLVFVAGGKGGFHVLDVEAKQFKTVFFEKEYFKSVDKAGLVEWPKGKISAFTRKQRASIEELTLIDREKNEKSFFALSSGSELDPLLLVNRKNGKNIFAASARNSLQEIVRFSLFDFYDEQVLTIPLPQKGLKRLYSVYDDSRGRLFGIFTEKNDVVRILQLYGPLPESEAKP